VKRSSATPVLLTITSFIGPACAQGAACPAEPTRYTIRLTSPDTARVVLDHTLASATLHHAYVVASDGTTTPDLVSGARFSGEQGEGSILHRGQGAWSVEGAAAGDRVQITYDLSLAYGDHEWPFGAEEVGVRLSGGAYLVSRVALLADYAARDCPVEIVLDAPASAAPWEVIAPGTYRAPDLAVFHDNAFALAEALGRFTAVTDQGAVTFVHDEKAEPLARQAASDMAQVLRYLTGVFGGFPASRYHIFLFTSDRVEGGAFDQSFAMLHPFPAQDVDALIWRQGFIHEIIHLWLGHGVRPARGADIEWFKEGFTDYLAVKTLWRLGFIDERALAEKLDGQLRRHSFGFLMSPGVKLSEAGANKSQNRMVIYGSGAVLALLLDARMSATKGPGAFEAMLGDLYEDSAEPYSAERLLTALDRASDGAVGRLLDRFDAGLSPLDLPELLEPYGPEMAVMIPDMFELDLTPGGCQAEACLPAFLRPAAPE